MKAQRVAVLITSHNRKTVTLAALEALDRQALPTGVTLHIFLVDAASTDGTRDAVRHRFPTVRMIEVDASVFWNRGMYLAFTEALRQDFDFYFWLNDDTQLYDTALSTFLSTMHDLYDRQEYRAIVIGSTCDAVTGALTYGGLIRSSRFHPLMFRLSEPTSFPQRMHTMNGNCVMIPRSVVNLVGTLDPIFSHSGGDTDYGLRANRLGCTTWIVPGFVGTCSRNTVQGTWRDPLLPLRERWRTMQGPKGHPAGEWKVLWKRYGGPFWPIYWSLPYGRVLLTSLRAAVVTRLKRDRR